MNAEPIAGRRALLAMAGGAVLSAFAPRVARAGVLRASALAFDGEILIVAGEALWRLDLASGGRASLALPGGAVRALACHPERPGRLLAALEGGGVAGSGDGGRTWSPAGAGLPDAPVAALAVAAADPDRAYAAVGGDGLWQSEDAGARWTFAMDRPWIVEAEREVLALASVNLASGMGGIWVYAGTDRGLTRVPDCFCRWQDVVAGDAMEALAAGRPPPATAPLPPGEPVLALASAHAAPERLCAALPSGLWASPDGGATWARQSGLRASAIAIEPTDPDHIVAATDGGLILSRDGGTTWTARAVT